MPDIVKGTRRLPAEVEDALWELVAHGVVSGDGVAGLRQLLHGGGRHRDRRRFRAYGAARSGPYGGGLRTHGRSLPVGRWSLWQGAADVESHGRDEAIARQLLRRYGVVFRDLVAREPLAPGWRVLLGVYRRWEAAGEIRGGRFVVGFVGEQFALPEAVESLRAVRRAPEDREVVVVSASGTLAADVFPYSWMFTTNFSMGRCSCEAIASMIRRLAWCGTMRSTCSIVHPARATVSRINPGTVRTASLNTACPSMYPR